MPNFKTVYVYAKLFADAAPIIAGRLDFFSDRVEFKYSASWLESPLNFAFHPDLLPLTLGVFTAKTLDGALGIFKDAGPGLWGKEIIKRRYGQVDPADQLILSNNLLRIGVLRFSDHLGASFANDAQPLQIEDIYSAIQVMESGGQLTELQAILLAQGSSMDGMRPKSFIEMDGESWIVKFPSKNDHENEAVCELIGMELARACGIETPEVRLVQLGGGRQALAVKRFDVTGNQNLPLMSAASAMGYAEGESQKRDYRYIAQALTRLSADPQSDCLSLFRRMALNVMISNRDDHIFNQALIMTAGRWHLSPAYDVVCGEGNRRNHAMSIGKMGATGSLANVISSAEAFGLTTEDAMSEISQMLEMVSGWKDIAIRAGVSEADISGIAWAILHEDIFAGYPANVAEYSLK